MTSRSDPRAFEEPEFVQGGEEEQAFLRSLADDLCEMLDTCQIEMARKFDGQMFDLDEGNALWSLLPASVRTAIKRGRSATPQICTQCGGCGSHTRNCITGGRFR